MEREQIIDEIKRCMRENSKLGWVNQDKVLQKIEELLPEDAVVLTKEEYEKLKNKPPFAVIKHDEDKMKEIAKEVAKNIILEFTEKGKDEIRKETAREILNTIASADHEVGDTEKEYAWYAREIYQLAQKYGVKVEE